MVRTSLCLSFLALLVGCRGIEREGQNPLPENGPPITYAEMINRARGQAGAALDAFYIDAWLDVEQAGQRLEQSARLLPKTTQVPESLKAKLETEAEALRKDAVALIDAAKAKNGTTANETMQRINQRIRALRPMEKTEVEKKL